MADDDALTSGPPRPWATPRHRRLRDEVVGWCDRHRAVLEGRGEGLAQDRAVHAALASSPFWAELLTGLGPRSGTTSSEARRDLTAMALAREVLAASSACADTLLGVQGLVVTTLAASLAEGRPPAATAGPGEHGETSLRALVDDLKAGRAIGAFALTEPEGGSDLAALRTEAVATNEGFLLRGTKTFVSCAGLASHALVLARTSPAGVRGLSLFLVPMVRPGTDGPAEGITVRPLSTLAPHDLGEITFRDVALPASALLGPRDAGFALARAALMAMRPTVGAAALGLATRALAETRAFLRGRTAFGQPLDENAALRARLADHLTDLEAARLLVYRATWLADGGASTGTEEPPLSTEMNARLVARAASMAKLHATEAAQRIVDDALQMHGARGVLVGGPIERLYREVRALRIYEGTSEIQRAIIARDFFADGPGS